MSEATDDLMVELEGQEISLASLAGEDLSGVAEQRFSNLPAGLFVFDTDPENPPHLEAVAGKDGKKKPAVIFSFLVVDCQGLKFPQETPEGPLSLIGRKYRETFFISDVKSTGYVKAFVKDLGVDNTGPMGGMAGHTGFLDRCSRLRFAAPIGHRKDKMDEDKVYVNIVRDKIVPMDAPQISDVAGQVG